MAGGRLVIRTEPTTAWIGAIAACWQARAGRMTVMRCWIAGIACAMALLAAVAPAASRQSYGFEIDIVSVDGSERQRLNATELDTAPAWAPDGTRIAFVGSAGGKGQIFVVRPDGGGLTQVTHVRSRNAGVGAPVWSPDGTRIAYVDEENFRLMVMNADGTGLRALAGSVSEDFPMPSWSPDGTRLTFLRGEVENSRISIVGADGRGLRTLKRVRLDSSEGGAPKWSPDGRRIAFVHAARDQFAVYVIRPDGTGLRRIDRCLFEPAWSPDGKALACWGYRFGERGRTFPAIRLAAVDGGSNRPIDRTRTSARLHDLTWAPDGTKLAYIRTERNRESLYTIDANGQRTRRLGSSQLIVPPIAWSPDGARIAFAPARLPRWG
jgi:Tol biopolymer transport system component